MSFNPCRHQDTEVECKYAVGEDDGLLCVMNPCHDGSRCYFCVFDDEHFDRCAFCLGDGNMDLVNRLIQLTDEREIIWSYDAFENCFNGGFATAEFKLVEDGNDIRLWGKILTRSWVTLKVASRDGYAYVFLMQLIYATRKQCNFLHDGDDIEDLRHAIGLDE